MSYIGEYRETPFLSHTNEGDSYLREFKVVKAFPALRNAVTRRAYANDGAATGLGSVVDESRAMGRGSASSSSAVRLEARRTVEQRERQQLPRTSKSIVEKLGRSIVSDAGTGVGPMSEFHGSLIREKLAAKKALIAKERTGLRPTEKAKTKAALLNDPDTTARVLAKIEYFAADFDADKFLNRTLLKGFTGRMMTPKEFREQIRRSLSLELSMEEVTALVGHFDENGDGYIECREFVLHFFGAAFKRRSEVRYEELEAVARKEKEARDAKKAAEAAEAERNFAILKTPFDEEDLRRGVGQLTHLAHWWNFSGFRDKIFLEPFTCSEMTPLEFQQQLLHSFNLKTRDAEMAALCNFFDTNGDGTVDGPEFLRGFFRMQQEFHAAVADRANYDNDRREAAAAALYEQRQKPSMRGVNRLRRPQVASAAQYDATGGHPMGRPAVTTLAGLRRAKQLNDSGLVGSGLGGEKRARTPKAAINIFEQLPSNPGSRPDSPVRSRRDSRRTSLMRTPDLLSGGSSSVGGSSVGAAEPRRKKRGTMAAEELESALAKMCFGSTGGAGGAGSAGDPASPLSPSSTMRSRRASVAGPVADPVQRAHVLVALAHGNDLDDHEDGTMTLFGRGQVRPKTLSDWDVMRRQGDTATRKGRPRSRDGERDRFGRPLLSKEKLKALALRLRSAMYGSDPRKWLARYDRDKGGSLDAAEFKKIVRGHMRVGRKDLSDDDLQAFVHSLDVDGGGDVSLKEILAFLKPDPHAAARANAAACTIQGLVRKKQARETVKKRRVLRSGRGPSPCA